MERAACCCVSNDICERKRDLLLREIYHAALERSESTRSHARTEIPRDLTYCELRFSTEVGAEVAVQPQRQVFNGKCAHALALSHEDFSARTSTKCEGPACRAFDSTTTGDKTFPIALEGDP